MRSLRFEPGLANGRLLQQPPLDPPFSNNHGQGEYWDADRGGLSMSGGRYGHEELQFHNDVAKGGERNVQDTLGYSPDEARDYTSRFAQPLQGAMFDPNSFRGSTEEGRRDSLLSHSVHWMPGLNSQQRINAHESYSDRLGAREKYDDQAAAGVEASLRASRMPDDLLKALGGTTFVREELADRHSPNTLGYYTPGMGTMGEGEISVRASAMNQSGTISGFPEPKTGVNSNTLRHEMGHRADFRSLDAERDDVSMKPYIGSRHPNPRAEGIADAFADRYSPRPPTRDYSRFNMTGYSTNNPQWNTTEAAVYAASRAHFEATGENPTAANNTEFLHKMMMTSPHAVRALRQTGLKNEGAEAVERYRGMRTVGTQMAMFSERTATSAEGKRRVLGYTPNPSLTGENPWDDRNRHEGVLPGESLRFESMSHPVLDIPEDHKRKP